MCTIKYTLTVEIVVFFPEQIYTPKKTMSIPDFFT